MTLNIGSPFHLSQEVTLDHALAKRSFLLQTLGYFLFGTVIQHLDRTVKNSFLFFKQPSVFTGSLVAKNLPANAGTQEIKSLIPCLEDLLEEEMATHSSILAWRILWTEETGKLLSIGSQRVGHDLATEHVYFL